MLSYLLATTISIKIFIFFPMSSKSGVYSAFTAHLKLGLATFQVLNSHVWPAVTIPYNSDQPYT